MYHLYDNNRRHLGMADSYPELQVAALQAMDDDGLPYCYIRWTNDSGQAQEARVTAASITAAVATGATAAPYSAGAATAQRRAPQQRGKHAKAIRYTNAAIAVVLLFLALRIAIIILGDPNAATVLSN